MTVFHIHFLHCDLIHNGDVAAQKNKTSHSFYSGLFYLFIVGTEDYFCTL
jgi:hypothetical protein